MVKKLLILIETNHVMLFRVDVSIEDNDEITLQDK